MGVGRALYQSGTFSALFDFTTRVHADRVFLRYRDRDILYSDLRRESAALGEAFAAHRLRRGNGVAFLSSNTPETLIARDAAVCRGLHFIALNGLSARADHVALIEDLNLGTVIVDDREYPNAPIEFAEALPDRQIIRFGERSDGSGLSELARPFLGAELRIDSQPDDIVRIVQTGGTTGKSKGVILNHRTQINYILMCNASWDLPQEMRFLSTTPLSHAAGTYAPLAMIRGGSFFMLPKFSPLEFQRAVVANGITCTMLVPTQMKRILQDPDVDPKIIGGIETIMYGAAPIAPSVLEDWLRRFGPNISQLYGQSESPMCITSLPKSLHSLDHRSRLASCGLPNIGVQVAIMRPDRTIAGDNEPGEIVTRSPSVMEGYWKREKETAEACAGDWLHTGDLGYRDEDGFYYIVGRAKELIISGGFNIYPKEIEDLIAQHPSVKDVAVIGVPDSDWGEAVKAFVVLHAGTALDTAALATMVRQRKGPVHAPKSFEQIDAIPQTALGKPDKKALRARYWEGQSRAIA
jgi:fatty-acyl-CoA synthase